MKLEYSADSFYNKLINGLAKKKRKNWINFQINFNDWLFEDLSFFSNN